MSPPPRAARALFGAALAICPPDFKREYGAAMRRDFAASVAAARDGRGRLGAIRVVLAAVSDVVAAALTEYASMLVRDLRFALRSLRRTPLFTAIIVATLAIAIGANAAVFGILDTVVLAPLPYPQPGRLVALDWSDRTTEVPTSLPDIVDAMAAAGSDVSSWAAFDSLDATVTGLGEPRSVERIVATPDLFSVLEIRPELGRFPQAADGRAGSERVAVIADGFWRSAFDAAPSAIGALVRVDGTAYRVIGVAPATMRQPATRTFGARFDPVDVWTFVSPDGRGTLYAVRGDHSFDSIARLAPGVSIATANAAFARAASELRGRYVSTDANAGLRAESLADSILGGDREVFFAIFAGVAAVLLVACANVANLLLSRAASRDREISIRTAIGASGARIVMQLLVEAFVLVALGGAIGVGLASALVRAFVALHPPSIARGDEVTIGATTLLYTFGVVVVATVAAGLAPALTATKLDIATALKSAGRGGDAHRGGRARDAFVATEIAITFALVVVAGLVLRSFVGLTAQPLGFAPANVRVAANVGLTGPAFATDAAREAYERRALAAVRAVPGVRGAAWASYAPFMSENTTSTAVVGRAYPPGDEPEADDTQIDPGYFRVLGARLIAGRSFDGDDRAGAQPVAIVNERFAREFFPGRSPIGERIRSDRKRGPGPPPALTIVGVVADVRGSLLKPAEAGQYQPLAQLQDDFATLLVDVVPGTHVEPAVASALVAADPQLPRPAVVPLESLIGSTIAEQRVELFGLAIFAALALALAAAGIFAVISFGVAQRTHEFGIRLALGAGAGRVLALVLARALRLVVTGLVAGIALAAVCARFVRGALFETSPVDPATFAVVTALVVAVALVAALLPGLRATRVDPIVALRYE